MGLTAVACLAFGILMSTSALAQNGADVRIDDFTCGVPNGDFPNAGGISLCDPFIKGNVRHAVLTPSGNQILTCNCKLPDGAPVPDSTEMHEGFSCGTVFGSTTDSRSIVTKSGRSNLTCTIIPTP